MFFETAVKAWLLSCNRCNEHGRISRQEEQWKVSIFSRRTGNLRAQMKLNRSVKIPFFGFYFMAFYFIRKGSTLRVLKDRKLKKFLSGRHQWRHERHR